MSHHYCVTLNHLSSLGSRWCLMFRSSGMAARGLELSSDEDPWKVSTFVSACLELLLSILLLLGAAIAFVTSQLVRYFGLEPPCSYIGCSHPDHPDISRHRKYLLPRCPASRISVNECCPACHLPRSYPKFQSENFASTDEYHDDESQKLGKEDSSSRDHNASEGDMDSGFRYIVSSKRDHQRRHQARHDHPQAYFLCPHCSSSLHQRFNQHNFLKRTVNTVQAAHYHAVEGNGFAAVTCRAFDEDNLPLFSAKSGLADDSNSISEDHSEVSSMSADSMQDSFLENEGHLRTPCIFDDDGSKDNCAIIGDSGDEFSLGMEVKEGVAERIHAVEPLPFSGIEINAVQTDSSRTEGFRETVSSDNVTQQLANSRMELAFCKDAEASFKHEKEINENLRKIDHESVKPRSLEREGIEESRDLIADEIEGTFQRSMIEALPAELVEGSLLEESFTRELNSYTHGGDLATGNFTEPCDLDKCLNRQETCESEKMAERKTTDTSQSEQEGGSENLALEDSKCFDTSNEGEGIGGNEGPVCESLSQPENITHISVDSCQWGENVGVDQGPMDASQALESHVASYHLPDVHVLEDNAEARFTQQGIACTDHSDPLQETKSSESVPLEVSALKVEDVWLLDFSDDDQFSDEKALDFFPVNISAERQLNVNVDNSNVLTESELSVVLLMHPVHIQVEEHDIVTERKVVTGHLLDELQQPLPCMGTPNEGQNFEALEAQEEKIRLEFCLTDLEPEPVTDSKEWHKADLDDSDKESLNTAQLAVSDLQDGSNLFGQQDTQYDSSSGYGSEHECIDALFDDSLQQEGMLSHGERGPENKRLNVCCNDGRQLEGSDASFDDGQQALEAEEKAVPVGEFMLQTSSEAITQVTSDQWSCQDAALQTVSTAVLKEVNFQEITTKKDGTGYLDCPPASDEENKALGQGQGQVITEEIFGEIESVYRSGKIAHDSINSGEKLGAGNTDLDLVSSENIQDETIQCFTVGPDDGASAQRQEEVLEAREQMLLPGPLWQNQQEQEDLYSQEDCGEGLDALKKALEEERGALASLEAELEEERNAAAIAASEAMAMISRLQEEKSAMQLEVAQFQRMSEEKAEYDQQALSLLKEILYKREKEKFALEKEVELYKKRLLAEKVEKMKIKRMAKENSVPSSQSIKPTLLLKGIEEVDGASVLVKQNQPGGNTDSLTSGQGQSIALEGGFTLGTLKDLQDLERKPSKRPRGVALDIPDQIEGGDLSPITQDECIEGPTGLQKYFLESSLNESNDRGHHELKGMGRSIFATDDEETQFILERLWVLEEELWELKERDDSGNLKQGSRMQEHQHQDYSLGNGNSRYLNEDFGEPSADSDGAVLNIRPKSTSATCIRNGMAQMPVTSWCPNALEDSEDDMGNRANPWNVQGNRFTEQGEEIQMDGDVFVAGGFLPVHDIYEVQPTSEQNRCRPLNLEGSEIEGSAERLGSVDLSARNISQELVASMDGSRAPGPRRVPRTRRLFSPHGTPSYGSCNMVHSNGWAIEDSPYTDDCWELGINQHDLPSQSMIVRDGWQSQAEEEVQQLTIRVKALEADRELLRQTLEVFKKKETGMDLLQEVLVHLQELRQADIERITAGDLPRETEPVLTHAVKNSVLAIKKRRYSSGPGQPSELPSLEESM